MLQRHRRGRYSAHHTLLPVERETGQETQCAQCPHRLEAQQLPKDTGSLPSLAPRAGTAAAGHSQGAEGTLTEKLQPLFPTRPVYLFSAPSPEAPH